MREKADSLSLFLHRYAGVNYMVATRDDRSALIYSPNGIPFRAVFGKAKGSHVQASWFDPRTGQYSAAEVYDKSG